MPLNVSCCEASFALKVTEMTNFFRTILPGLDMYTAVKIIRGLTLIHPQFIHLLDYQLQEPPNPL